MGALPVTKGDLRPLPKQVFHVVKGARPIIAAPGVPLDTEVNNMFCRRLHPHEHEHADPAGRDNPRYRREWPSGGADGAWRCSYAFLPPRIPRPTEHGGGIEVGGGGAARAGGDPGGGLLLTTSFLICSDPFLQARSGGGVKDE
jgi:hypothetical protein